MAPTRRTRIRPLLVGLAGILAVSVATVTYTANAAVAETAELALVRLPIPPTPLPTPPRGQATAQVFLTVVNAGPDDIEFGYTYTVTTTAPAHTSVPLLGPDCDDETYCLYYMPGPVGSGSQLQHELRVTAAPGTGITVHVAAHVDTIDNPDNNEFHITVPFR